MAENKKFSFDGQDYSVTPFEPFKAIEVLGELQKIHDCPPLGKRLVKLSAFILEGGAVFLLRNLFFFGR